MQERLRLAVPVAVAMDILLSPVFQAKLAIWFFAISTFGLLRYRTQCPRWLFWLLGVLAAIVVSTVERRLDGSPLLGEGHFYFVVKFLFLVTFMIDRAVIMESKTKLTP